ncbi:MAG: type IV pilus secretin PilQ, partial [Thermodesulfobacteriota bacterium]
GCSTSKVKEDFFENWKRKAEESKGHSPRAIEKGEKRTIEKFEEQEKEEPKQEPEKELPTQEVTLKIRDADIKTIIRSLARAADQNILINKNVQGSASINIEQEPWDQAFKSILSTHGFDYEWKGNIIKVVTPKDLDNTLKMMQKKQQHQEQIMKQKQVVDLATRMININYADAEEVKDSLQQTLIKDEEGEEGEKRGSIVVDEHNNALIIKAIPEDMDKMLSMIDNIDKPTNQINIKAHIVETNRGTGRLLGMQWGGMWRSNQFETGGQDSRVYVTPSGTDGSTSSDPIQGGYNPTSGQVGLSGQGFNINFPAGAIGEGMGAAGAGIGLLVGKLNDNILDMQLSALQEANKAQILSSPSITTMDNQMAYTESGSEIPYETTSEQGTNIQMEKATLRLEVTPHIITEGYLKMDILVKKDEPNFSDAVEGRPLISKRQTETTCIVRNGETIVISGLTEEKVSESDQGVPLLKNIPGLGWMFKGDSSSTEMTETLVFITPDILKKPGQKSSS